MLPFRVLLSGGAFHDCIHTPARRLQDKRDHADSRRTRVQANGLQGSAGGAENIPVYCMS